MLVGDAARMIDPLTGGGIANGCIAGKICGEVAANAVHAGDASAVFLQAYEKGWRARLEEKLYRNWLAKEKLCTISDETFDKLIDALAGRQAPEAERPQHPQSGPRQVPRSDEGVRGVPLNARDG